MGLSQDSCSTAGKAGNPQAGARRYLERTRDKRRGGEGLGVPTKGQGVAGSTIGGLGLRGARGVLLRGRRERRTEERS